MKAGKYIYVFLHFCDFYTVSHLSSGSKQIGQVLFVLVSFKSNIIFHKKHEQLPAGQGHLA